MTDFADASNRSVDLLIGIRSLVECSCTFRNVFFFFSLFFSDATKITLAPANADVSVGENARMQCAASHDSSLDLTFIWSLDGHAIDLDKEKEYYQYVMVRAANTLYFNVTIDRSS